jgi:hypothetical protein
VFKTTTHTQNFKKNYTFTHTHIKHFKKNINKNKKHLWLPAANWQPHLGGMGGPRATLEVIGARGVNPVTVRSYWQKLVTVTRESGH